MPAQTPFMFRPPTFAEEVRAYKRKKFINATKPGDKIVGRVTNITNFGVFVALDEVDGLVHVSNVSWAPTVRPMAKVSVGQVVGVQVLGIDSKTERVSLGMKQLRSHPWDNIEDRHPLGSKVRAKVVDLFPRAALVQLEEGVQGRLHVSDMSWSKRVKRPADVLTPGQEIDAVVLGIEKQHRYLQLGVRQLEANPWNDVDARYPVGTIITRPVTNLIAYGAFIELEKGVSGLLHVTDFSWTRKFRRSAEMLAAGQEVQVVVLEVDQTNQRIKLGIKQLQADPWSDIDNRPKIGDLVKGRVSAISHSGATVRLAADIGGFIHSSELGIEPGNKVNDAIQVGDEIEVRVTDVDPEKRCISLTTR